MQSGPDEKNRDGGGTRQNHRPFGELTVGTLGTSPPPAATPKKSIDYFRVALSIAAILFVAALIGPRMIGQSKPVIYLYPEEPGEISVKLDYKGTLAYTYPEYRDGWRVTAHPDGTLIDLADGREYSYLFWDGHSDMRFDFSKGFVVKGSETAAFLREKLAEMGMTPREYNEFIVYWLPLMGGNPYNLISFQGEAYTKHAILTIEPEPDSVLRVFMAFKPLQRPVDVPPQAFAPFERKGFTVVEWGGSKVGR